MNQLSRLSDCQTQAFADWCDACVEPATGEVLLLKAAHVDHLSWMRGLVGAIEDFEAFQQCFCHEVKDAFPQAVKQTGKNGQISFKGLRLVANAYLIRDKLGHKTTAMTNRYVNKDSKRPDSVEYWFALHQRVIAEYFRELNEPKTYKALCARCLENGQKKPTMKEYHSFMVHHITDEMRGFTILYSYADYEAFCKEKGWRALTIDAFEKRLAEEIARRASVMAGILAGQENERLQ